MTVRKYYLGCPMWANKEWLGMVMPNGTPNAKFLYHYSRVFNSVEGNTTFYALPKPETVQVWANETPADFRFTFKFPRQITHEHRLHNVSDIATEFLECMQPLADKVGLLTIQLPPSFSAAQLPALAEFLQQLPEEFQYAVEPRHLDFFDGGSNETMFDALLQSHGVDRILFDTVRLFQLESNEPSIVEAQRKKPRVPERWTRLSDRPMLRYVGSNDKTLDEKRLQTLSKKVAQWLQQGAQPYVFIHAPNTKYAPLLAEVFHERLQQQLSQEDIGTCELVANREPEPPSLNDQMDLF